MHMQIFVIIDFELVIIIPTIPATRASLGHRLNQSMVHPDINAGNFKARFRNFSPTGEKHRTTWRFFWTRDMKYSYRFSLVGGRLGNSRFITGTRSLRISSLSSRANKLDTWAEKKITLFWKLYYVYLCQILFSFNLYDAPTIMFIQFPVWLVI